MCKYSCVTFNIPLVFREVVRCNIGSFVGHVSLSAPALHTAFASSTLKGNVGLKLKIKVHCQQQ